VRTNFSITTLLFGTLAFVWVVPLAALAGLRIYDGYLLRQTEYQLITESVLVGEALRAELLRELGRAGDQHLPPTPGGERTDFAPVSAQIDFDHPTLPAGPTSFPRAAPRDGPLERAGRAIEPLLRRAQAFNLSGVRVLDERGCVIATTRGEAGSCMHGLPEVEAALAGRYRAVLRERVSDEPAPPLGDIRRRGRVRVFTALPVFSDGRVIAVVRASRTGLDALSSLWANRRGLLWLGAALALLLLLISLASSAAIVGPLRRLTRAARGVAQGEDAARFEVTGRAPAEIAELSRVLSGMARELEARARYVREFASQVSHELKTPLTAIRGAAELLHHGLDDMPAADRQRFIANIEEDARRMERLVGRLLELARAENRRSAAGVAPLDAVALARELLSRHGAHVELAGDARVELAIAEEELASVLGNLVDNALRHGAGQLVRVTLRAEAGRLRIEVTDRGSRPSEATQRRLFERFFTTERDRGGSGLGLAIVRAIAEARGGSASARFDERGSTFSVLL
jgi:signal transduction histidine kinase